MKNDNLVSAIIPAYNAADYIESCVSSILEQTYENVEIIIVNDGSTDQTARLCKAISENNPRVKLIHTENCGTTVARKTGLDAAQGKWISFVDSDDYIEPDMYEKMMCFLLTHPCDFVSCGYFSENQDHTSAKVVHDYFPKGLCQDIASEIYSKLIYATADNGAGLTRSLWNKLFLRSKMLQVYEKMDSEIVYGEDMVINFLYCLQSKQAFFIHEPLYHYRKGRNTKSTRKETGLAENTERVFRLLKNAVSDSPYQNVLMLQIRRYVLELELHHFQLACDFDPFVLNPWTFQIRNEVLQYPFVLYGAGICGQALFATISKMGYAPNMVAWCDMEYAKLQERTGFNIVAPETIVHLTYETLLIGVKDRELYETIRANLIDEYCVSPSKICWFVPETKSFWDCIPL